MKEQIFRYYKGEENIVVVEKENYEESLFREQYIQALQLVTDLAEHPKKDVPNLVAFCGDRGEGKTSCMLTVCHIIKNSGNPAIASEMEPLGIDTKKLYDAGFEVLPIIDPAFFDKEHNIIELLLGHIYKNFKAWRDKDESQSYGAANDVAKLFQKTKACLMHIGQTKVEMYDPLEELEVLSAGVELSECISTLMEKYLALTGKKKLLICIDDIDLNMSRAYRMCEEIRKYLNNPHCLILMSVKVDQLIEAIQNDIHKEADYPKGIEYSGMASKYVAKLIPVTARVNMPQAYDLCEYKLKVYNGDRRDTEPVFSSQSVKNGVVRKIFATSRFLFYNSKGSVSPIVPNNLRSLTQLLGLLFSMSDIDEVGNDRATEVLENNKHLFKAYFYKTWVKLLNATNQAFALGLTTRQDGNDLNKYIVSYLANQLQGIKADNSLISGITDSANFNYNISIGDVLYLVSYLEQSTFEEEVKNVLFFIKSFYSIRLFEKYDIVTNSLETELYPDKKETGNLYRADVLFDNTNTLQRAVSGSYFSYISNELLSPEKDTNQIRDLKVINGKGGLNVLLNNLLKVLRSGGREGMTAEEAEEFDLRFRMAEFFILAVSTNVLKRDIPASTIPPMNRKGATPYFLSRFNSNTGYYVFDVLAPFYSLTNPQYAYGRFKDIADIWAYAENNEWSLLRRMMDAVREKEMNDNKVPVEERDTYCPVEEKPSYWMGRLLSNAVIRNAEVALAVMENSRNNKIFNRSSGKSRELIADFYKYVVNTNMMTYNRGENEEPYYINFDFLSPIVTLLKDNRIDEVLEVGEGDKKLVFPTFSQIFNYISDKKTGKYSIAGDLFAESLKRFQPTSGFRIVERIKKNQIDLYSKVPESEWSSWFEKDKQYTKEEAIDILQKHILEFVMEGSPAEDED